MNTALMTSFGFSIIFLATTCGALAPFFVKDKIQSSNVITFGFSGGIMIAASVWSLILPSIEASSSFGVLKVLPPAVGILSGGIFMTVVEVIVKKYEKPFCKSSRNPLKLFIAITVHNIPEGLAVGVAFGSLSAGSLGVAYAPAMAFAIGIAVQNFPEGAAVALPFFAQVKSKRKAFLIGALSGVVEPIFAVIGYFISARTAIIEPWLSGFSAGAMLFVAMGDLLPEIKEENKSKGIWSALIGFLIMMTLDVVLS